MVFLGALFHHSYLQKISCFKLLTDQLKWFSEKPPKGFEKYFEPDGKKTSSKRSKPGNEKEAKNENQEENNKSPKLPPPPPSKGPGQQKSYDQWSFGLFGGTGNRSSGGKPFGENEKDKFYILGALGTIATIGLIAYYEMGYKEIGWKEFVHM